jgi:hypothetical protein
MPTSEYRDDVSQLAILDWLAELRETSQGAAWNEHLDFGDFHAIDALSSAIFLAVLNALREDDRSPPSATRAIHERGRLWGYHLKHALMARRAAWKSALPAPADVLLWPREVTHSAVFRPLLGALAVEGMSARLLACQPKTFMGVRRLDPFAVFAPAAWPRAIRAARRDGLARARQLAARGPWQLPPLGTARPENLEPIVRELVVRSLAEVAAVGATARCAIDTMRPKVLVVGNDLTLEGRVACRVARARGVPTAVFMHGVIAGEPLHALHCADRVLVYGPIHREQLLRQGVPAERIVVCGNLVLDDCPRQSGHVHPLVQKSLGIGPDERFVLVATSGPGHSVSRRHHELVIEAIGRLSAAMPTVPIVVKLHRKDRPRFYRQFMQRPGGARLFLVPYGTAGFPPTFFDWLQGCGAMLTGASMAAQEAMLLDVPVITMDLCGEIRDIDFIDGGATVHVRNADDLERAVRETLAGEGASREKQAKAQSHLQRAFHAVDGGSGRRGAQALCELAQRPC